MPAVQGQEQGRASPGPRPGPARILPDFREDRARQARGISKKQEDRARPGLAARNLAGPRPGPVPAPGSPSQSDRDMKKELPTSQVKLLAPAPKGQMSNQLLWCMEGQITRKHSAAALFFVLGRAATS